MLSNLSTAVPTTHHSASRAPSRCTTVSTTTKCGLPLDQPLHPKGTGDDSTKPGQAAAECPRRGCTGIPMRRPIHIPSSRTTFRLVPIEVRERPQLAQETLRAAPNTHSVPGPKDRPPRQQTACATEPIQTRDRRPIHPAMNTTAATGGPRPKEGQGPSPKLTATVNTWSRERHDATQPKTVRRAVVDPPTRKNSVRAAPIVGSKGEKVLSAC